MNNVELKKFIMDELKKEGLEDGLTVDADKLGDIVLGMTRSRQNDSLNGYISGVLYSGTALVATGLLMKGIKKFILKG